MMILKIENKYSERTIFLDERIKVENGYDVFEPNPFNRYWIRVESDGITVNQEYCSDLDSTWQKRNNKYKFSEYKISYIREY